VPLFQALRSIAPVLTRLPISESLQIKRMRGETPQPRKPWGATQSGGGGGQGGGGGRPKRLHTFDTTVPIGVHLNLSTLAVEQVDSTGQASNVRVGWVLAAVDGNAVHSGADLKAAMGRLASAPLAAQQASEWTFEVPRVAPGSSGPALCVVSGQVVRLCGEHDASCRLSCKHMPKIAFRLDPNKKYKDLQGRPVEAVKYFPEGRWHSIPRPSFFSSRVGGVPCALCLFRQGQGSAGCRGRLPSERPPHPHARGEFRGHDFRIRAH